MLDVDDINTYYGDSHVLHGVSLHVEKGRITTLLGRNGAGKTTTLLSMMGYLPVRGGRIRYEGCDITGMAPHRVSRLGVGLVPQERGVFPSLSVEENLTVAARPGHGNRWKLAEIYDLFPRLRERRANMGFQLSGGEQQMVSIARALMLNPALILMDEPSEGLAPLIVREIVDIITQLKNAGIGILLIEQNLNVALELSDMHYILDKGAVCFTGTSDMLRDNEKVLGAHLSV